jgi:protein TonB
MPSNPWRCADFLERVRPGIAISAAIHAGLFFLLAYLLAFHSPMPASPVPDDPALVLVPPPVTPPKPQPPTHSDFHLTETPRLPNIDSHFTGLTLPPELNFDRTPDKTPVALTPQPPRIINPQPLYRGGLVYPERAAGLEREGYVDFDFIIEPDGTVGDPVVVAEVPDGMGFAAAAKKAFPKWRFKPMTKDGVAVAAPARIRVSFKLS